MSGVELRKNSRGDAAEHAVHASLLAPGQRHYWIILKWVDYHRFQTTCDSSQRDSLICKNFIYAWHALITKGVCAFNSPQRDACNVCQDGRVKTSRPLAQAHKRLGDAQPFHALQRGLGSIWDLSLLGNSLLFQDGQFQIWVTGIKHPSIHPSPVLLLSGWQGGGVNSSWLRSEGGAIPQTSCQKANTGRWIIRPKFPSVKTLQVPVNPACLSFHRGTKLNTRP